MLKTLSILGGACAVAVTVVAGSLAQPSPGPGAAAVLARRADFGALLAAAKGFGDEIKKGDPDIAAIRRFASRLAALAPELPRWFPAGSGPEAGLRTAAKPEIWTDPAAFHVKAAALVAAAHALDLAAQAGDLAGVRAARPAVLGACQSCHEAFEYR